MLIQEAEASQAERPECEGFVQPLIKFAKGFQLKKMRDFLEQYIDVLAE